MEYGVPQPTVLDRPNIQDTFKMECSICFEGYDTFMMFFVDGCSHVFCRDCLAMHCGVLIKDGQTDIKCPDLDCKSHITYPEIKDLIENNPELDDKYESFLFNNHLEKLDDITWCPIPHCSKPCPLDGQYGIIRVKCLNCEYIFCGKCGEEYHEDFTCEVYKKYKGKLDNFDVWLEAKGDKVKRCPDCKYLGEKISGCSTVKCIKCKHYFCWRCAQNIEGDQDHFNAPSGYCVNTYRKKEQKKSIKPKEMDVVDFSDTSDDEMPPLVKNLESDLEDDLEDDSGGW